MILAGDIGGTHTRLALFEKEKMLVEQKFPSRNYPGLEEIVQEFLQSQGKTVSKACFGVAGPVREEKCVATNLPWIIDASRLRSSLRISLLRLLNDLEANAYGLKRLKKEELFVLNQGLNQKGNQALISAGTGLGEAGLFWDGNDHHPFACEGGHTDFAPRNEMEVELFLYLRKKFGHVSYERVISGPGLQSLYEFLIETGKEIASPQLKSAIKNGEAPAVISEWGIQDKDPGCARAVDWFISLYGAEAGNLALKFLSLGGLFIGGGIAPHLIKKLKNGAFISAFKDKGRFRSLLESIPVWVILNDNTPLLGAAYFADRLL